MQVRTFIDRPILAGVISVLLVLIGLIGLSRLALEQFPEIAPPTVRVNANYTGANAATVQKSVVVVLEEAINGVEGMMYMQSTASNTGSANVSIFFRQGTDPDMAMVNVSRASTFANDSLPISSSWHSTHPTTLSTAISFPTIRRSTSNPCSPVSRAWAT